MAGGKAKNTKLSRNGGAHPFAQKDPKPTRARLVSLLDPLGRKRYGEVERFLATVSGATSGLFYYDNDWGWAVRYMLGTKDSLCTLHLLPNSFEATVALGKDFDVRAYSKEFSSDLKRRIGRTRAANGTRWVRLPIRSDNDYGNFQDVIRAKADCLRKPAAPKAKAAAKPAKSGSASATAKSAKPAKGTQRAKSGATKKKAKSTRS